MLRHILFCRSMWQETWDHCPPDRSLFLLESEVSLASVGTPVQEHTRASALLHSGRASPLGFWKPLEG